MAYGVLKRPRMNLRLGITFLVLNAAACTIEPQKTPKSTSELALNEITVDLSAQSYEDGKVGVYGTSSYGGSELSLGAGDSFLALVPGVSSSPLPMNPPHAGGIFTTTGVPPYDVTVVFDRRSPSSESRSTVSLPAPPHVLAAPASLTQGDDLVIDLTAPPPSDVTVRLRLNDTVQLLGNDPPRCLPIQALVTPTKVDGVRITLAANALFARDPKSSVPKTCDMIVGVRFETKGHRADDLGGGTIVGLMERAATPIHVTRTDE